MTNEIHVYTDGGSRGNPGPAACGIVIKKCSGSNCQTWAEKQVYLGEATNNQAEYQALLLALNELLILKPQEKVIFFLDSQLVVEQLNGRYKMKNVGLKPLFQSVQALLQKLKVDYSIQHIPRIENKRADMLVNMALDTKRASHTAQS